MKLDVEATLRHQLVLICGPERSRRTAALESLLEKSGTTDADFDLELFDGDSEADRWLASAQTAPFLADRRTIVVRHVLRADADQVAGLGWSNLPTTALLILVADDEQGDESRQRTLASNSKKWEKLVKAKGGSLVECTVKDGEIAFEIKEAIEREGKKISPKALALLKEMTGPNLSRALEEVPKLVIYVGTEPSIQEADVQAVVTPTPEWNVFSLVDAATEGRVGASLIQLRSLLAGGSKVEGVAIGSIVPMLSRALRLTWQARVCVEASCAPENAPPHVRARFLQRPNLAQERDFVASRAMRSARKLDFARLSAMLSLVSDADSKMKGLLPSHTAIDSLENLVLKLCEVAASAHGVQQAKTARA